MVAVIDTIISIKTIGFLGLSVNHDISISCSIKKMLKSEITTPPHQPPANVNIAIIFLCPKIGHRFYGI